MSPLGVESPGVGPAGVSAINEPMCSRVQGSGGGWPIVVAGGSTDSPTGPGERGADAADGHARCHLGAGDDGIVDGQGLS